MIRFYCEQCGKSLRASAEIVGKKTRCTACSAKMTVPQESTRKSGENRQARKPAAQTLENEKEILSVLADSDSFESFEDFDFSSLQIDTVRKNSASVDANPVVNSTIESDITSQSTSANKPLNKPLNKSLGISGKRSGTKSVDFQSLKPSLPGSFGPASIDRVRLLQFSAGIAGLLVFLVIGYWVIQAWSGEARLDGKTEFENSPTGMHYAQLLRDLRKVERVMYMLEEGYLSRKLPESGLTEVRDLRNQVKDIAENQAKLKEANALYVAGDEEEAKKVLREEKRRMTELTEAIKKKNDWLTSKVYSR